MANHGRVMIPDVYGRRQQEGLPGGLPNFHDVQTDNIS